MSKRFLVVAAVALVFGLGGTALFASFASFRDRMRTGVVAFDRAGLECCIRSADATMELQSFFCQTRNPVYYQDLQIPPTADCVETDVPARRSLFAEHGVVATRVANCSLSRDFQVAWALDGSAVRGVIVTARAAEAPFPALESEVAAVLLQCHRRAY